MAVKPTRLTLRCYGVGFGDCFLLTFHYAGSTGDRHVLIDFGSTQSPPNAKKNFMKLIANDIAAVVGPRLHVLIATHRHADHISGFETNESGTGTGDIIAALEPQLVVQPWTERPDAPRDFVGPDGSMKAANDALRLSLARMSAVAGAAALELDRGGGVDGGEEAGVDEVGFEAGVESVAELFCFERILRAPRIGDGVARGSAG